MEKSKQPEIVTATVTQGAFGSVPGLINDGVVERIIEPPEGGTFIKFIGCEYLYKGTTKQNVVDVLEFPKRALRNLLILICRHKILLVILLSRRIRVVIVNWYLKNVYLKAFTKHLLLSEKKYCISVREIWRVITLFIGKIKGKEQSIAFRLRNIGCMILETDIAYRFMLQDFLPEINKQALKENSFKEIKRVLDIFIKRYNNSRWKRIKKLVVLLLKIKKIRKLIVRILLDLDLDKIKLDDADWYFCLQRPHYDFRGISLKERLRQKRIIDKQKHHFIPDFTILKRGV